MVVRVFVNVERDEGEHADDGRDKTGGAGRGEQITAAPAAPSPMPERRTSCCGQPGIKEKNGRLRFHSRGFAGNRFCVAGKQAAAAGGNDVGLEAEKILQLQPEAENQHRQQQEQQAVFDADQRVIRGAGVDVVDRQPHGGEEKDAHLADQRRKAVVIDVERANRAHGADEHAGQPVGVENKEQQGGKLDDEDEAEQR